MWIITDEGDAINLARYDGIVPERVKVTADDSVYWQICAYRTVGTRADAGPERHRVEICKVHVEENVNPLIAEMVKAVCGWNAADWEENDTG
jgi:hypothetical protein